MPTKQDILNIPQLTIRSVSGQSPIELLTDYTGVLKCLYCKSKRLRKKDTFIRRVRHESIGLKPSVLHIKSHKFACRDCHRYFNQRLPGILPYQRATERLKEQVFIQHTQGISQKDLARTFKLGKATIERYFHHYYARRHQEFLQQDCPKVLGIDEHFFSQKQGFATTLCNLGTHRIFDVVPGRSMRELSGYFAHLKGRDNVKVVCMDLSNTYRQIIRHAFPNAKIVADRFHVIRLINQSALQTYHHIDETIKYQRGILRLLRTQPQNLSDKGLMRREAYLDAHPAIAHIDTFKQRLHQLLMLKARTAKQCKKLLPRFLAMVDALKASPFEALKKLGKTLYAWREEIVRMWRFTKSNGITEGFHRKMKLIQRRAYGFRNFENYRIRVKVLCA